MAEGKKGRVAQTYLRVRNTESNIIRIPTSFLRSTLLECSLSLLDYTVYFLFGFLILAMGQHSSCIQGKPDWTGPYEKASAKPQDTEIYEQIRKLATITNAKDLDEFENFLRNKVNPTCPQHGTQSLLHRRNSKATSTSSKNSHNKLEDMIRKESIIKDINFNQTQADNKPPSVKETIVNKSTCVVHAQQQQKQPCRVHGSEKHHQSPPAYSNQPKAFQVVMKPEYEDFSDDAASTFSCPEFLTSLILPSQEVETLDILASVGVQSAKETIQRLEDRAESIVETFGVVLKHLEHGDWSTFCISTSRLCDDIKNVMRDYHLNTEMKDPATLKIKKDVTDALNKLTTHILSFNHATSSNHNVLLPSFKTLGEVLHEMMEFLITKELKVLIDCLKPETKICSIRMATCALAEMSLSGNLMSKLIVQAGAVQPLLQLCQTYKCKHLRPLTLRVLTVICGSQEAFSAFEKVSGFRTIMALLSDESDEKVLCETVGLLAQTLKFWSENKSSLEKKIGQDLEPLVQYLTVAAKKSLSPEMFLLSAACLATLSACNTKATGWLKQHAEEMRLLASSNKHESYV